MHSRNTYLLSILGNFEIQWDQKPFFIKFYGASINQDKNHTTVHHVKVKWFQTNKMKTDV